MFYIRRNVKWKKNGKKCFSITKHDVIITCINVTLNHSRLDLCKRFVQISYIGYIYMQDYMVLFI